MKYQISFIFLFLKKTFFNLMKSKQNCLGSFYWVNKNFNLNISNVKFTRNLHFVNILKRLICYNIKLIEHFIRNWRHRMNWLIGFLSFYLFVEGVAFCSTVSVPWKRKQEKSNYCKNCPVITYNTSACIPSFTIFELVITNLICNMQIWTVDRIVLHKNLDYWESNFVLYKFWFQMI